jgi:hypothetical protein
MALRLGKVGLSVAVAFGAITMASTRAVDAGSCSITAPPADAVGTVSGSVIDEAHERPVFAALIEWDFANQVMTSSTDAQGRFALRLPISNRTSGEQIKVSVRSNLHESDTANIVACPGANKPLIFRLKPTTKFATVSGEVVDAATRRAVPNAIVAILIGKFPQPGLTATTDRNGRYTINHVGFAGDLVIQVTTSYSPCVRPAARKLDVHQAVITEDFVLPEIATGRLRCQSGLIGPKPAPDAGSGNAGNPQLPDDSRIHWQIASSNAFLINDSADAWNSGHINDVLMRGPTEAVVASDSGGVWSVAWNSNSAAAIPLSTTWGSINMTSLAQGPDGTDHFYAGTYDGGPGSPGGFLWETDTSSGAPLLSWVADKQKPQCDTIEHVLVIAEFRRVVIACDTGIWWSQIPPAPAAHGVYNWEQALPGPGLSSSILKGHFARLVKGPGWGDFAPTEGTIAAIAFGGTAPDKEIYAAPGTLIFWGSWSNGKLIFNAADVAQGQGNLFLILERATMAACPLDPHIMYAVGSDPSSHTIAAVWKSIDGGQGWGMVNTPGPGADGMGWYNEVIAVSPADCSTLAIGWQHGAFVSFDGGNSYTKLDDGGAGHLHDDYHALLFNPFDPQTLLIGSDGGLASASGVIMNGMPTFASYYNQHLFDLQFFHTSPSFRTAGLVAGALQDNAVLWSVLPNWWTRVPTAAGDGQFTQFAGVGSGSSTGGPPGSADILAWSDGTPTSQWLQSVWNGGGFFTPNPSTIPLEDSNNPRDPTGIPGNASPNWSIRHPSFMNGIGQLMYIVAGRASNVYGLFANSDGSDLHWESIGSIGGSENVTAISSSDGNVVFVGTDQGNIYQLQPYTGPAVPLAINEPKGGVGRINGLFAIFSTVAFAATGGPPGCDGCVGPAPPGYVLTYTGQSWEVAGGGLTSDQAFVTVDGPNVGSVFVATSDKVFVTHDLGSTWLAASDGLPTVPQSNELHYGLQPDGTGYMYLSTFGWSVFRAPL